MLTYLPPFPGDGPLTSSSLGWLDNQLWELLQFLRACVVAQIFIGPESFLCNLTPKFSFTLIICSPSVKGSGCHNTNYNLKIPGIEEKHEAIAVSPLGNVDKSISYYLTFFSVKVVRGSNSVRYGSGRAHLVVFEKRKPFPGFVDVSSSISLDLHDNPSPQVC